MSVNIFLDDLILRDAIESMLKKYPLPSDLNVAICTDEETPPNEYSHILVLYHTKTPAESPLHERFVSEYGDNYKSLSLPLPFSALAEILASFKSSNNESVFEKLSYEESDRCVTLGEKSVNLSVTEGALFKYLYLRRGFFVSREELREKLWEDTGKSNVTDVYASYLRRKLRIIGAESFLVSRRGVGYMIV